MFSHCELIARGWLWSPCTCRVLHQASVCPRNKDIALSITGNAGMKHIHGALPYAGHPNFIKLSPAAAATEEFDGSDSGARPDEAVSWGKIRMDARPVKAGPCSLFFSLIARVSA